MQHNDDAVSFWSFIGFAMARHKELSPGLDVEAMRMGIILHRFASIIRYDTATHLRGIGLSPVGFSLAHIMFLYGRIPMTKLVELSGRSRASVSAACATLASDGIVDKIRPENNGKLIELELTETGYETYRKAHEAYNKREVEIWSALSCQDRRELTRIFNKVMDSKDDFQFPR